MSESTEPEDPLERCFQEKGVVARLTSRTGWGLFAQTDFSPGDLIFHLDVTDNARSLIIDFEDHFDKFYDRGMTYIPGAVFAVLPAHPFWAVNHSCNANAGFANWGRVDNGRIAFVAFRHIYPGEQITLDYSAITTAYEGTPEGGPWEMKCLCGEPNCRRIISGFDALTLDVQLSQLFPESGPQGRVLAHILNDIPELVERLRAHPTLYREFRRVLQQQLELGAQRYQRTA